MYIEKTFRATCSLEVKNLERKMKVWLCLEFSMNLAVIANCENKMFIHAGRAYMLNLSSYIIPQADRLLGINLCILIFVSLSDDLRPTKAIVSVSLITQFNLQYHRYLCVMYTAFE